MGTLTAVVRAFAARCDLLGLEALPLALLALDALLLAALAGGLVERLERASGETRWGPGRALLASGLVGLAAVVGSATLLGAARRLSSPNLLALHAGLLALFAAAEWSRGERVGPRGLARWALRPLAALVAPLRGLFSTEAWRRDRLGESVVLLALVSVLGFYLVLALFTPPLNYDSVRPARTRSAAVGVVGARRRARRGPRGRPRRAARAGLGRAAVAIPLGGFNFSLNSGEARRPEAAPHCHSSSSSRSPGPQRA
ncbi:MAG TPA: hypothetical protein VGB13_09320 [Candidatus Krumholzibacteria bacterium]